MKSEHYLISYTKINSIWFKDLNVRPDTQKLLEENIGRTLFDINHSNIILDPSPTVMDTRAKINKWNHIKSFCFCLKAKKTIKKMKRKPMEWEKILVNEAPDTGLISKISKQLIQLNNNNKKF